MRKPAREGQQSGLETMLLVNEVPSSRERGEGLRHRLAGELGDGLVVGHDDDHVRALGRAPAPAARPMRQACRRRSPPRTQALLPTVAPPDSMRNRLAAHRGGKVHGYRSRVRGRDYERNEMPENLDDAKGRVKEAAGDLTDDDSLKNEGKVDQATGKVKDAVGDAADKVKDVVNPDDK